MIRFFTSIKWTPILRLLTDFTSKPIKYLETFEADKSESCRILASWAKHCGLNGLKCTVKPAFLSNSLLVFFSRIITPYAKFYDPKVCIGAPLVKALYS